MLSEEKEVLGYIKEAFKLRSQKLYKPAVEMLYKALDMDNDNIEVLFQLGELYFLMCNYERSLSYLEQVLSIEPSHLESIKLSEKIYFREEYYSRALELAKVVFEKEPSSDSLKDLVILYGKLNLIDSLDKALSSEFLNDDVIYEIANAYYINSKIEKAKDLLTKHFEGEKSQILLGRIYFDQGEIDKSREIFSQFSKYTENPDVLNYLGLFAIEDMDFTEAIKFFSKAVSYNKNNAVYSYNLGNAYFYNGWMTEAQKAYSKAIYLAPDNLDYRYSLAYLYYETSDFDKCKKEVDAILAIRPDYPQVRVLQALLLNNKQEYMQAKEILEDNVKKGFDDTFTLISLGRTYKNLDMFDFARKTIQKVIDANPENLDYLSDLADVYIAEKDFDKAIELAQKTISNNENYIYAYVIAAKAYIAKEDFDNAKKYAQEALCVDMNCSDAYYYLALVRFHEEDYDEAIECMKRAITYNASNPEYYAQMSNIYKAKEDIKTALDYISEAADISSAEEYKLMYKELAAINRKNVN